jgi:hypothetical protein
MAEQVITKTCGHCKAVKPIGDFYKNKAMKGGLSNYCKVCTLDYQGEKRYKKNITKKIRQKQRQFNSSTTLFWPGQYQVPPRCLVRCARRRPENITTIKDMGEKIGWTLFLSVENATTLFTVIVSDKFYAFVVFKKWLFQCNRVHYNPSDFDVLVPLADFVL